MKTWAVILIALLAGLLYLLNKQFPYAFDGNQSYLTLLQMFAVISFITFGLSRQSLSKEFVIKSLASWLGIAVVALSIYSYQWELKQYFYKIFGQLVPSMAKTNKDGSVTFYAAENGHFMIDAKANGRLVHFLLDTGATRVTLGAKDAKAIGIDIDALRYDIRVQTAKGINLVAYVKLDSVEVGSIIVRNVQAYVAKEGLSGSLLGVSFLKKLRKYEVHQGKLTLWK
jgi:aspartyl protease family protein